MKTDYLIIGNSAGGIGAVEAIRRIDASGSITMISDEPYPAYSRPLISEFLAGERELDGILYRSPDFYENHNVKTLFGKSAKSIQCDQNTVLLKDRQKVAYGKLLVAIGGNPIFPPMEGSDKKGVFTFTTLDNAKGIADLVKSGAKKAVVIGGGLIGISVTDALRKLDIDVTVVELMDRILGAVMDCEASQIAREAIEASDVEFCTGHTVKTIFGKHDDDSVVGGVILDDGTKIDCDMVVVAIGVVPRLDLVKDTDIKTNRGIVVDRHMQTSYPNVYACGDVSEAYDYIFEGNRVVPIWPNAHIGGRIAGYNMAGKQAEHPGGTAMNSLKYFGMAIASAGIVNPTEDIDCEVLSQRENGRYQKFVIQDDRLVGMVMTGDIERAGIFYGIMRDGVKVNGFKNLLLSDQFGLINLPEHVLKQRLELPDLGRLHVFHEVETYEEPVTEG